MCVFACSNTMPSIDFKLWFICMSESFVIVTLWRTPRGLNANTSEIILTTISMQHSNQNKQSCCPLSINKAVLGRLPGSCCLRLALSRLWHVWIALACPVIKISLHHTCCKSSVSVKCQCPVSNHT